MMSKRSIGLLAASMMMSVAHASDNGVEIDMSGTVIASTCDVETADTLQTVYIGNFASTLFSSVGDVSPSADNDNSKLLALSDTAGAGGMAAGVGVEILDANKNSVAINTDSASQPLQEGDNNTLTFFLRYKATKIPVTAGNASSVMYFDLSYQ